MSDLSKMKTVVSVKEESTEGTYVAPASASDYLATNEFELKPMQELLERSTRIGKLGKLSSVTGMRSLEGSLTIEFKAHGTAGTAPQYSLLMKGGLGSVKTVSTTTTTKSAGNTGTSVEIEDADVSKFAVGDIVLVKESGAYHVTPITAIDSTTGSGTLTFLIPKASGNFSNSVVIEKYTNWKCAESHPSLSVSEYEDNAQIQKGMGVRVASVALKSWEAGQMAMLTFSLAGLDYTKELGTVPHTPSYDNAIPPAVKCSKLYIGTDAIEVLSVSWELKNDVGFKTTTQSCSGRESGVITGRSVTGSVQIYKDSTEIDSYTKFRNGTEFPMFGWAGVPTGVSGEFKDIVAWYMPKCKFSEMAAGENEGISLDEMSFVATMGDGTYQELSVASI